MDRIQAAALILQNNALKLENIQLTIEVLKVNARQLMDAQPALTAELEAAQEEAKSLAALPVVEAPKE